MHVTNKMLGLVGGWVLRKGKHQEEATRVKDLEQEAQLNQALKAVKLQFKEEFQSLDSQDIKETILLV